MSAEEEDDDEVEVVDMETEPAEKEKENGSDGKRSSHKSSSKDGDGQRSSSRDGDGHRSSRRSSDREKDREKRRNSSHDGDEMRRSRRSDRDRDDKDRRDKDRDKDRDDRRGSRSRSSRHLGSSSRHDKDDERRSSSYRRSSTSDGRERRSSSYKRSSTHDGSSRKSSSGDGSRDRRRSSRYDRDKDKDRDRDRDRRKSETREEREERKRKEKEDKDRERRRHERREKEREERRRKDEEMKKKREELRSKRHQSKGHLEPETSGNTLMVNRADLRQVSKEKFNSVYKMGKKIYQGEETKVHICYHWATGTERCVKITPKKSSTCHEFDMLKNMDHPNILTMYDLFVEETDGFEWYLVVDLCKGKSLYYYLQKRSCKPDKQIVEDKPPEEEDDMFGLGGLMAAAEDMANALVGEEKEEIEIEEGEFYGMDENEVKEVMLQVMSCVNYLHKNQLVHADLKPQNLIMGSGIDLSTLKMLDFDNSAHLRKADDKINIKKGTPEYMAPEVHAGNKYDYKCDIWSCGVLCYQLLTNTLPFGDSKDMTEEEIAAKVEEGKFTMAGPAWGSVSDDAKDFVKSLLILRDKKRPTAERAINHKWLTGGKKEPGQDTGRAPALLNKNEGAKAAMSNFKNFKADTKLKKATCAFIASQLLTKEEKDKIDDVFRAMDVTRDGRLSKTEVKSGFFQVFGTFLSDQELDEMFERIDCDGTGEIEYSEFVIASMSETDLLSKDRLKKAFQLFDKDNSGSITISELREIFSFFQTAGADMDEAYIDKVISQVDNDGNGDVSFEEFCEMMTSGMPI